MNNKHQSERCSIDLSQKAGRTRLSLNEKDLYEYIEECCLNEKEDDEPFSQKRAS